MRETQFQGPETDSADSLSAGLMRTPARGWAVLLLFRAQASSVILVSYTFGCFFLSSPRTWISLHCGQDCCKACGGLPRRCFRCLQELGSPGFDLSHWFWCLSCWRSHFFFTGSGQQLLGLASCQVLLYYFPRDYYTCSHVVAATMGGAAPVCHGQLRRTVAA